MTASGFWLGLVSGVLLALVGFGLAYFAAKMTERRAQKKEAKEAYAQADQILSRMAEKFPGHAEERENLRELLRTQSTRFAPQDVQHLQVALLEETQLEDLERVRALLERRTRPKADG